MGCKITQFFKLVTLLSTIGFCLTLLLFSRTALCADVDTDAMETLQERSREKIEARKSDVSEEKKGTEDDLLELEDKSYEKKNRLDQSIGEEPVPETMKSLEEQSKEKMASEQFAQRISKFEATELLLDLPPDTVLVTLNSDPMVYVDEFNQRVAQARGKDLFDARYKALVKIVDTRLMAALAKQEGFENDPLVKKARKKASEAADAVKKADQFTDEISDEQAWRYYDSHIDQFRRPDKGTRVLFVVKADINETLAIQKRIKNGEPFSRFSFLPDPIPGSWLPEQVQKAFFSLEPGQVTDVIKTPVGIFIVQLIARNNFDNFKVSVINKNNLEECKQALKFIEDGREFEALVSENEQLAIDVSELPDEIQWVVPEMDLNEISQPIATLLGYFLVKLQDRWSDAGIITAKLIKLNSEAEGLEILGRLKKGLGLGQIEERRIAGKDLPKALKDAAKRLNEKEYSTPVKTPLGYYLVKVEKRSREKYFSFQTVADEIKNRIKSRTIKEEDAYKYYQSNLSGYPKPGPEYILDIILSDNQDEAETIVAELRSLKEQNKNKKEAAFKKYRKDLDQRVTADLLPVACQKIVADLQPGQISPVITTHLGYFILRLDTMVNPAFVDFENVRDEIKLLLVDKKIKQNVNTNEHKAQIAFISMEEEALDRAFLLNHMKNVDSVTDEEAELWWQANKNGFFTAFRIDEKKFKFPNPEMETFFKKRNVLLQEYRSQTKDLYAENNVVILDYLLEN